MQVCDNVMLQILLYCTSKLLDEGNMLASKSSDAEIRNRNE